MQDGLMRSAAATIERCSWVRVDDPLMLQYHDREWGVPETRSRAIGSWLRSARLIVSDPTQD